MVRKNPHIEFEQVIERGCGIDIHKIVLVATIRGIGIKEETRSFNGFTESPDHSCRYGKYRCLLETCV
jgi:hypothetical protein